MSAASSLEAHVGSGLSLLQFSAPFARCEDGRVQLLHLPDRRRWRRSAPTGRSRSSAGTPAPPAATRTTSSSPTCNAGRYDAYIQEFAGAAAAWGHPFFLRFNWEMNGPWFPWGAGVNGNTAAEFRAAWRRVHSIFDEVGATNATWVWCPYASGTKSLRLRPFYPGGRYVDWTCLDTYNWGPEASQPPWHSFRELLGPTYHRITERIAPHKPMMIGEVATTGTPEAKAYWIHGMFAALRHRFDKVRGLVWFNKIDGGVDWPLDSAAAAERLRPGTATRVQAERLRGDPEQPDPAAGVSVSSLSPIGGQTRHAMAVLGFDPYSQAAMRLRRGWLVTFCALVGASAMLLAPLARAEWLPPVDISATSEHAGQPHVALDSEGNATAVWDRWDGTATVVETAYRPAGAPWGEPELLSPPDSQSAKVVVDRNGVLTVVWQRWTGVNHYAIESVSRLPGHEWSEPVEVTDFQQGAHPEPWLAVDWEGNTTVVWKQGETIMSSFRTFALGWGEPVPLSPGESFTPQTAMDARGDATAVWMHDDGSHLVVEGAYRPEQGEWEEATLVSAPGEEGGNPQVAVDGKGDSLVVWRGGDEGEEFARAAYRPAGGSWSEPVDVSTEGERVQSLRAALDPEGNAIVAWSGQLRQRRRIRRRPHRLQTGRRRLGSTGGPLRRRGQRLRQRHRLRPERQRGDPLDALGRRHLVDPRSESSQGRRLGGTGPALRGRQGRDGSDPRPRRPRQRYRRRRRRHRGSGSAPTRSPAREGKNWSRAPPTWSKPPATTPTACRKWKSKCRKKGTVGEEIEVSTPTEGLYSPQIEFGDGAKVAGTEATHVYDEPGTYLVKAAGAEELGYVGFAQETITISGKGKGEEEPETEPDPDPGSGGAGAEGGTKVEDPPPAAAPIRRPGALAGVSGSNRRPRSRLRSPAQDPGEARDDPRREVPAAAAQGCRQAQGGAAPRPRPGRFSLLSATAAPPSARLAWRA